MFAVFSAPFIAWKIGLTLAAVAYAYVRPPWPRSMFGKQISLDGVTFSVSHSREKYGPGWTVFTARLPSRASFEFNHESWVDRFFKRERYADEIQVGRPEFDDAIYVQSDSEKFARAIRADRAMQAAIVEMLKADGLAAVAGGRFSDDRSILLENGRLRVMLRGDVGADPKVREAFAAFHRRLTGFCTTVACDDDRFAGRAIVVQCLCWGFGAYGVLSAFELIRAQGDVFVNTFAFGEYAVIAALFLFSGFLIFVFRLLQGSSRLPRVISSYAGVLLLAFIPAGVGLFADLNRYLPQGEVVVERVVRSLDRVERHSSKGPRFRYFGCFDRAELAGRSGAGASFQVPACMELSRADFERLHQGQGVRFHMGRGALGFVWYKNLQAMEM